MELYVEQYIKNIRILGLEAVLPTSLRIIDRWAWPAHIPQIYCFRPFWIFYNCLRFIIIGGYSYSLRLGWVFSRVIPMSKHASACCIGLGSSDTQF